MPRNLNVYPFRFFGEIFTPPAPAALSRLGVAFSCLRHSTVPCLLSVSVSVSGFGWGMLMGRLVSCELCLMPCVVPLDLTAVASAVYAACCVLRRMPVFSACPPHPALIIKQRRRRHRRSLRRRLRLRCLDSALTFV